MISLNWNFCGQGDQSRSLWKTHWVLDLITTLRVFVKNSVEAKTLHQFRVPVLFITYLATLKVTLSKSLSKRHCKLGHGTVVIKTHPDLLSFDLSERWSFVNRVSYWDLTKKNFLYSIKIFQIQKKWDKTFCFDLSKEVVFRYPGPVFLLWFDKKNYNFFFLLKMSICQIQKSRISREIFQFFVKVLCDMKEPTIFQLGYALHILFKIMRKNVLLWPFKKVVFRYLEFYQITGLAKKGPQPISCSLGDLPI